MIILMSQKSMDLYQRIRPTFDRIMAAVDPEGQSDVIRGLMKMVEDIETIKAETATDLRDDEAIRAEFLARVQGRQCSAARSLEYWGSDHHT